MIFLDKSVLKSLETTINENNVLTIDSKNRLFPIDSTVLACKILESSKKKKPITIIVSSDVHNSNKTISCIALAFSQIFYKHNFSVGFFVDNKNLAIQIIDELVRVLEIACELTNGKDVIHWDYEKLFVELPDKNSKIELKILDNLPTLKLKDLLYDIVIVDDAHKISKSFYETLQKSKCNFIILNVTNSLIKPHTFINNLL